MSNSPHRVLSRDRENRLYRGTAASSAIDYRHTLQDSMMKDHGRRHAQAVDEGMGGRYRSRSPYTSDAAKHLAMGEQRYAQINARYAVPERIEQPPYYQEIVQVKKVSQHQDFFVSELQNEVAELQHRQRDFRQLEEQFQYLQDQFHQVSMEKQQFENEGAARIAEDRNQAEALTRELDCLKQENYAVEEEQFMLLQSCAQVDADTAAATDEVAQLRNAFNHEDVLSLNNRKENEHLEGLIADQKEVNHQNYAEIVRLKDIAYDHDKELDGLSKQINVLHADLENNDHRIHTMQNIVAQKDEQTAVTCQRMNEAHQAIGDHKYSLNKLDGELGYFENANEQHKNAQQQLFKANEYEYTSAKDGSMRCQELQINLGKIEQDEKAVAFELDRLKEHNDQMLKDQMDLQQEIDALDKHMSNLNNQNYCLQKELEDFVQADDAVRTNLDRKHKVDHIRSRVDDVIRRSQAEVESRHFEADQRARSANLGHSPVRDPLPPRAVFNDPSRAKSNQYSFGNKTAADTGFKNATFNERSRSGYDKRKQY